MDGGGLLQMSHDELAEANAVQRAQRKRLIGRYAICLAAGAGRFVSARTIAEERYRYVPLLHKVFDEAQTRSIVEAGDTTTSGWASQLVPSPTLSSVLLELIRSRTLLD